MQNSSSKSTLTPAEERHYYAQTAAATDQGVVQRRNCCCCVCSIHVASVVQMTHMLLVHGGVLKSKVMNRTQQLATYWSATVHDYEHGGLNNDFLIKTAHPLAVTYNDSSPLENHHLAASSRVLYTPEFCFPPVSLLPYCSAALKACSDSVCGCTVHLVDSPEDCFLSVIWLCCCSAGVEACSCAVCVRTLQLVLRTFMPIMQHMCRHIPKGCHRRTLHKPIASLPTLAVSDMCC